MIQNLKKKNKSLTITPLANLSCFQSRQISLDVNFDFKIKKNKLPIFNSILAFYGLWNRVIPLTLLSNGT